MKKLVLVFTRDFIQWLNQMVHDNYVFVFPHIWGRGLKDQIIHYTGRAVEFYRYIDDYQKLGEYITHKNINDYIFKEATHKQFRRDVDSLRKLLAIAPRRVKDSKLHFKNITVAFNKMYPFYTLACFLPGPWRDKFVTVHGKKGEMVLSWVFQSREHSEGVAKECDIYLRKWLCPLLQRAGHDPEFLKLLSVAELNNFVNKGKLPALSVLKKRALGYVYLDGKILSVTDFQNFLVKKNLAIFKEGESTLLGPITGAVACRGGLIKGQVQTLFNSAEATKFKKGRILVTPMTSPEYLSAIKKAVAVVTDEGGLSCHAAIVSRELNIPCVIGTKIATKVLKDGNLVEVDANRGIVKIIK